MSDGIQLLQGEEQRVERQIAAVQESQGLTGWLLDLLRGWSGKRAVQQKQLTLVETLSLGGKRQLMLVSCAGAHFLVGGGMDSIETIVRLPSEQSRGSVARDRGTSCQ
jgi:flagellar biogenesis protein FliO